MWDIIVVLIIRVSVTDVRTKVGLYTISEQVQLGTTKTLVKTDEQKGAHYRNDSISTQVPTW